MKIKSFFLSLAAICSILLASCSKESPVVGTIPADVKVAVRLDGKKALAALDIKVEEGTIVLPEYLKRLNSETFPAEELTAVYNSIDPAQLYLFMTGDMRNQAVYMTGAVTDAATFGADFKKVMATDGYKTASASNGVIVWTDTQFWFTPDSNSQKSVEQVKELLKKASDKSLADVPAVADALAKDNMMTLAINSFISEKDGKKEAVWSVTAINTKGNKLKMTSESKLGDGTAFTLEGVTDIDSKALRFLPANSLYAGAAGLSDKLDWGGIFDMIYESVGATPTDRAQMGMILPYLQGLDGTIAFGIGLAEGETFEQAVSRFDVKSWQGILMAHMKKQIADEIIKFVTSMAPQAGMTLTDAGDGLYLVSVEGIDVYFGVVDGYLTLANYKPQPVTGASATADRLKGGKACFYLEIPNFTFAGPELTFGLTVTGKGSGNKNETEFTLTNTTADFFPTILGAIK